jgi:mono/diheme cytochrome c family protein
MFNLRNVFLILLSVIVFSCNNQKSNSSDNESLKGKEYYLKLCASCHGKKGNLKLSKAADLTVSYLSSEDIFTIIKSGKGTMPSFSRFLSDDQILLVTEYCLSLRKKE